MLERNGNEWTIAWMILLVIVFILYTQILLAPGAYTKSDKPAIGDPKPRSWLNTFLLVASSWLLGATAVSMGIFDNNVIANKSYDGMTYINTLMPAKSDIIYESVGTPVYEPAEIPVAYEYEGPIMNNIPTAKLYEGPVSTTPEGVPQDTPEGMQQDTPTYNIANSMLSN